MLCNLTLDKIRRLRWNGFLSALEEQMNCDDYDSMSFLDRLGFLIDREISHKENRKYLNLLTTARLRQQACFEGIEYKSGRGLDKTMMLSLASCEYIRKYHNVLIDGPTGVGKTYIACALGNKACLQNIKVRYFKSAAFFLELQSSRLENKMGSFQKKIRETQLLIIDDFGLQKLDSQERLDFMEILDDRVQRSSTIIVTQLPVDEWHAAIGDATVADAILDRFIHCAYQIRMKGESMRKVKNGLNQSATIV
jgi:DNA replication protein DnaC